MPTECPVMKTRYHLYPAVENFHFCDVDFTFFHASSILVPMKLLQIYACLETILYCPVENIVFYFVSFYS